MSKKKHLSSPSKPEAASRGNKNPEWNLVKHLRPKRLLKDQDNWCVSPQVKTDSVANRGEHRLLQHPFQWKLHKRIENQYKSALDQC